MNKTKSDWTPSAVRQAYNSNPDAGHFFDRSSMRFFGDTMRSYRCVCLDGVDYMIRRPTATVNVFGTWKTAGREFFGAWRIVDQGGRVSLAMVSRELREEIFDAI